MPSILYWGRRSFFEDSGKVSSKNDLRPHFYVFGSKCSATPFIQYRRPVGPGPSSNTWPRCPPQDEQWTSVRTISQLRSSVVPTARSSALQKLGHPVPLLNFVSASNSG